MAQAPIGTRQGRLKTTLIKAEAEQAAGLGFIRKACLQHDLFAVDRIHFARRPVQLRWAEVGPSA
jgi:hypothetical protein